MTRAVRVLRSTKDRRGDPAPPQGDDVLVALSDQVAVRDMEREMQALTGGGA